jgi:cation transporter-like permease
MIKRPAVISSLIAVVITLGFMGYMLSTTQGGDAKSFIMPIALVLFPFVWFFVWLIVTGIARWQGLMSGHSPNEDDDREGKRD